MGVTPEKAIKLAVNDATRGHFARRLGTSADSLPLAHGMLCGATAGFCQVVATNPMEIVKIQMQLAKIRGTSSGLLEVIGALGIRGLYRGTFSTLCRDVPFSLIFFQSFASIKHLLRNQNDSSSQLGKTLLAGMIAGGLAAFVATPMDGTFL